MLRTLNHWFKKSCQSRHLFLVFVIVQGGFLGWSLNNTTPDQLFDHFLWIALPIWSISLYWHLSAIAFFSKGAAKCRLSTAAQLLFAYTGMMGWVYTTVGRIPLVATKHPIAWKYGLGIAILSLTVQAFLSIFVISQSANRKDA